MNIPRDGQLDRGEEMLTELDRKSRTCIYLYLYVCKCVCVCVFI